MNNRTYTAFNRYTQIASGALAEVALEVKKLAGKENNTSILIYNDETGGAIDIDIRGTDEEIIARMQPDNAEKESRGRGRPKLGVVAREVTLLPRHWEWLNEQPGGASVMLRKLVEQARRENNDKGITGKAQEATYHFMSSMAGNLPGFEEAVRALYRNDEQQFLKHIAVWPEDVRAHAARLAQATTSP